jgi:hypothetical protein
MLESAAHRALSLAALRALYRIEVELSNHSGDQKNGLLVTFQQFEEWGVRRHTIASAIRELEALGFIKVTKHGYDGASGKHAPNKYRLTYRPSHSLSKRERNDSTNEWRKIETPEEAEAIAAKARKGVNPRNVERGKEVVRYSTKRGVSSPHEKGVRHDRSRPTKRGLQAHPTKRGLLSRFSGAGETEQAGRPSCEESP